MRSKKKTIYAFIDSNNLHQGVSTDIPKRKYKGWKIDYKKLRVYLEKKYNVSKAYLFIGYIKDNEEMYTDLKNFGYELIYKPTVPYINSKGDTITKGNVDAELVLQTMIELKNYDTCIIVAGDGDYKCLVEYLVKEKKLEKLLVPNQKMYSSLLIPFKEFMVYMNPLNKKLGK